MNAAAAVVGARKLLGFVETLGQWIRQHLMESDINVKGKVEVKADVMGTVKVVLDLGPQLEGVIRDILRLENKQESPVAYWARATRELISGGEKKFNSLHQLGVSDYTLGMEALTQDIDAIPDAIKSVMRRYVERYEASDWASPASPLLEAFETDPDSESSLDGLDDGWPVAPEWDKPR